MPRKTTKRKVKKAKATKAEKSMEVTEEGKVEFGKVAFGLGIVVAFVAGAFAQGFGQDATVVTLLGVLGLIVGALNIQVEEIIPFLIAVITFMVTATALAQVVASIVPGEVGLMLIRSLQYMVAFVAPAGAIVALITIFYLSKD